MNTYKTKSHLYTLKQGRIRAATKNNIQEKYIRAQYLPKGLETCTHSQGETTAYKLTSPIFAN